MNIQELILDKIKSIVTDYKPVNCKWISRSNYSNCGCIYFIDMEKDLATLGSLTYDFQDRSFNLRFFKGAMAPTHSVGFDAPGTLSSIHGEYHNLPDVISKINSTIKDIFN